MLLHTFSNESPVRDTFKLWFQCSPHYINSALYPIAQHLKRAADFEPDDDAETRLDKLKALFAQDESTPDLAVFADLLSLPYGARYGGINLPSHALRERLFAAVTDRILQLARRSRLRPVMRCVSSRPQAPMRPSRASH